MAAYRPLTSCAKFVLCVSLFTTCFVRAEIYESIQWTPHNPKFRFTEDQLKNGIGYYRLPVLRTSKITFVCPNPTTVLSRMSDTIPKELLFENLWMVNKASFERCSIDVQNKKQNKLLFQCKEPSELRFKTIVFQQYSATDEGLEFSPGQEYYFIATSSGLEGSINSTSGGHCRDKKNGISMRVVFYICNNISECDSLSNGGGSTCTSTPINATEGPTPQASMRIGLSSEIMMYLTIAFAAAFAVSFLVNVILCACCIRKPSGSSSQDEEDGLKLTNLNNEKKDQKPEQHSYKNGVPAGMENRGLQTQISQLTAQDDERRPLTSTGSFVPKSTFQPTPKTRTLPNTAGKEISRQRPQESPVDKCKPVPGNRSVKTPLRPPPALPKSHPAPRLPSVARA